eukprot:SM000100S09407  [mRNA]  locus=s100:179215:181173:+ [translate_table: standard]
MADAVSWPEKSSYGSVNVMLRRPPSVAVRRSGSVYCLTCTADQTLQVVDDVGYCAAVDCTAKYGSAKPRWDAVAGLCQALEPPTVTCLPGFVRGQLCFDVDALDASSQACETPTWPSPRAAQPNGALVPKPPIAPGPPAPRPTPSIPQPPARPRANPLPAPVTHPPLVVPNSQQPSQSPGPDCSGHGKANADGAGCDCSAGWSTNSAQGMTGVVFCNVPIGTLVDPPGTKPYPVAPAATMGSNSSVAAPSPTDTSSSSDLADSSSQPFLSRLVGIVVLVAILLCCCCCCRRLCCRRSKPSRSEVTTRLVFEPSGVAPARDFVTPHDVPRRAWARERAAN